MQISCKEGTNLTLEEFSLDIGEAGVSLDIFSKTELINQVLVFRHDPPALHLKEYRSLLLRAGDKTLRIKLDGNFVHCYECCAMKGCPTHSNTIIYLD